MIIYFLKKKKKKKKKKIILLLLTKKKKQFLPLALTFSEIKSIRVSDVHSGLIYSTDPW